LIHVEAALRKTMWIKEVWKMRFTHHCVSSCAALWHTCPARSQTQHQNIVNHGLTTRPRDFLQQSSTTTGRSKEEATIHMLTTWLNITYTSKSFRNWMYWRIREFWQLLRTPPEH
jgi:hypothetical protein